jgi:O-antigen/teichoic acid export membrane protein
MTSEQWKLLSRVRAGALILAAVLVSARVASHGFDVFILVTTALLVGLGLALRYVELHTRRPLKNYLRWLLAAVALGLVLIALPFALGANLLVGSILWIGLSAAGLVWCIQYERTESL